MSDEWIDPFEEHFRRSPLPGAAVRVVALARGSSAQAEEVAQSLLELLSARGRTAETVVAPVRALGENKALQQAIADTECPLLLVTSAEEPWTTEHLDPLLAAIDHCDIVVGRRKRSILGRLSRWLARIPWKFLFAVPVLDVHSPCRLYRLEKLAPMELQSTSEFLDVEILAKATFLGHLIDEVAVPALRSPALWSYWHDFMKVLRHPVLIKPSRPAEDPEGDVEGGGSPDGQNGQGGSHVQPSGPLEDHPSQPVEQLGERQNLDEGLNGGGESL